MTGIEAAIAILAQRPFCRVVLISGHAAIADLLHEPQAQEHSFEVLTKPVHPAALLEKLRAGDFPLGDTP